MNTAADSPDRAAHCEDILLPPLRAIILYVDSAEITVQWLLWWLYNLNYIHSYWLNLQTSTQHKGNNKKLSLIIKHCEKKCSSRSYRFSPEIYWLVNWPKLHPSTKFHEISSVVLCNPADRWPLGEPGPPANSEVKKTQFITMFDESAQKCNRFFLGPVLDPEFSVRAAAAADSRTKKQSDTSNIISSAVVMK